MVAGAAGQVGSPALTSRTQVQSLEWISVVAEPGSVITRRLKMVAHLAQELQ